MKVDGYKVENKSIADVIDKLTEADGSCENTLSYLADAARLLAIAIADIAEVIGAENEAADKA